MKGIEKITDRIIAEATEEANALKAEAQAKADEIKAEYENEAAATYESRLEKGRFEAAQAADRRVRNARLQAKKDILAVKQQMIDLAYEKAKKELINMPEQEYVDFLTGLAAKACTTGSEKIFLNDADKARVGQKVLSAANASLAAAGKEAALKLADETVDITGGLIVKQGDVEVNCSVEALVNMSHEELDVKVAKVFFR